ncbi:hypothetical protein GCM10027570_27390 [Streptomonospora sediminis]
MRTRLAAAAGRPLAAVEQRAAASICYQGLAARLLCPAVAAALCHGVLAPPDALQWVRRGGRLQPALGEGAGRMLDPGRPRAKAAADLVSEHVLTAALVPLAHAVRAQAALAPRLLYGNAASALAGAVQALGADRPDRAADADALARLLLQRPPLQGLGVFAPAAGDRTGQASAFTRTTCCLYYRVPGGGLCGDCAVAARTHRR